MRHAALALSTVAVLAGAGPAGAAVRGDTAAAAGVFKVAIPKTGSVTVAQLDVKAPKKPRLAVTNKAGVRAGVTVVGEVAKKAAKKWTVRVVVANRNLGKSAAGAGEDFGFVAVNATVPGVSNRGVTAGKLTSFLNTTVLATNGVPGFMCADVAGTPAILAGDAWGKFDATAIEDFGDDALCGKQAKGAAAFFGSLRGVAVSPVALTQAPTSVATGDFDGDASPDIAVAEPGGVELFVGLNDGTFGLPLTLHTGGTPVSLAAADIDLDGIVDLAVVESSPNQIEVFSGAFLAPRSIGSEVLNGSPLNFTFGNANTDADIDLFVGTGAGVQVFENNGKGDFSAVANLTVPNCIPLSVAFGRIDGDAIGDIVYVGEQPGLDVFNFFIFTGNGNDTFGGPYLHGYFTADHSIYGPGSEMIVLFGHSAATYASHGLRVFPNVFPTFGPEQFVSAGTAPVGVVAVDVNRDNLTDLIALNRGSGTLSTVLATPAGGYSAPKTSSPVGSNPVSAAMLDFNNDGVADIVVANAPPAGGAGSVDILSGNGQGVFQR